MKFVFSTILIFVLFIVAKTAMTNQNIIQMNRSELSQEFIVAKIPNSKNSFDTPPEDLEKISGAKAADAVTMTVDKEKFAASTATASLTESKESEVVRRAVKVLRQLASSPDVGINYADYSFLVEKAKTEVEVALANIKNPSIRETLRASLCEYEFASTVWQAAWNTDYIEGDLKSIAVNHYKVSLRGLLKVIWRNDFLAAIWRQGRNKFEIANNLLAQTYLININSDDLLTGAWKIIVSKDSKQIEFDMTITKNGSKYNGVLRSTMGNSNIFRVAREGNYISFFYSEQLPKLTVTIDFKGILELKTINGIMVFTQGGRIEDAPFAAVKF